MSKLESDDDDIYKQLDGFEHSLDSELQNFDMLQSNSSDVTEKKTKNNNSSVDAAGKSTKCPSNDDNCNKVASFTANTNVVDGPRRCKNNGRKEHCNKTENDMSISHTDNDEAEEDDNSNSCCSSGSIITEEGRDTYIPPPSAWFQLDDQYIGDGGNNKEKEEEEKRTNEDEKLSSQQDEGDQKEATNEQNAQIAAAAIHHHAINYRVHRIIQPSSSEESAANNSDHGDVNKDEDELILLPEYNSTEAHLFDLPTIQSASIEDSSPISAESDENDTASIRSTSISSQLEILSNTSLLLPSITTLLQHISSSQTLTTISTSIPLILHEYTTSAISKSIHKLRLEYNRLGPGRYLRASDIGSVVGRGYVVSSGSATTSVTASNNNDDEQNEEDAILQTVKNSSVVISNTNNIQQQSSQNADFDYMWTSSSSSSREHVQFTTLPWIERQLVHEWRTYEWQTGDRNEKEEKGDQSAVNDDDDDDDDDDIEDVGDAADEGEGSVDDKESEEEEDHDTTIIDEDIYNQARTLAPRPLPKPQWENATSCYTCHRTFNPTLHRHHCRRCGHSYCHTHSNHTHILPHLGYDATVPERVCKCCKVILDSRDLNERVEWRLARCRDLLHGELTPYFETGVDTVEDVALRLTRLAISLARTIPLGAQAYVAIESVEVLRKHGLKGVYGLLLRKEFLAAADLLCRVLGINKKNWPLSVHELSAAIFYALAQHRALRGVRPDGEEMIHSLKVVTGGDDDSTFVSKEENGAFEKVSSPIIVEMGVESSVLPVVHEDDAEEGNENNKNADDEEDEAGDTIVWQGGSTQKYLTGEFSEELLDETDVYDPSSEKVVDLLNISASAGNKEEEQKVDTVQREQPMYGSHDEVSNEPMDHQEDTTTTQTIKLPFDPVCEAVHNSLISTLLFYAPLALDFIYAECEVDMQLLAAQQGWRLVYASLDQNHRHHANNGDGTKQNIYTNNEHFSDKPASALFAHDELKIACLSIRGTATIQDIVTDIRAMPVPFPQEEDEAKPNDDGFNSNKSTDSLNEEWTSVFRGNGLALCGMAGGASNLFRETADSLLYLALNGYKVRIVGHSLGGAVAVLLGILITRHFEKQCTTARGTSSPDINEDGFVQVYSYGTPSCVDAKLADHPRTLRLCTSVVLHGK